MNDLIGSMGHKTKRHQTKPNRLDECLKKKIPTTLNISSKAILQNNEYKQAKLYLIRHDCFNIKKKRSSCSVLEIDSISSADPLKFTSFKAMASYTLECMTSTLSGFKTVY